MATTIKSAVITVCLFVAAVGLYRYTQTLQERQNPVETVSKIYTALDFYGKNYDKTGFLQHTIKADTASYDDGSGIAHFTNPIITTYRIGKDKYIEKWTMSGRFWFQTGRKCRRNIRKQWLFRQRLTKLCFSM